VDPEQDTDREIDKIYAGARGALAQNRVRIIAINLGIMFQNEDDTRSQGGEANQRLERRAWKLFDEYKS
jgi:hypothetical protein